MTDSVDHELPGRLTLSSLDVSAGRESALRELFPEAFLDNQFDPTKIAPHLSVPQDESPLPERYGLSWAGKADAMRAVQVLSTGTLHPDRNESVDFDTTSHLMIEGDNLEVLKLLQRSYYGKVKMIYIDPPYNTGKDFIYPDNYREGLETYLRFTGQLDAEGHRLTANTETDGRYHSKWLSMMSPRLVLSRNLLRSDGVFMVSIDDSEAANLRLLLDEVFGPENFIAQLVWEKSRKNDAKFFSVGHEYLIVYARSFLTLQDDGTVWREAKPGAEEVQAKYEELRTEFESDNEMITSELRAWYKDLPASHPAKRLSRYKHVDDRGVWRDRDISWPGGGGPRYDVIHPETGKPCEVPERGWGFASPESMQDQIDRGLVVFREDHTDPPIRKAYLVGTGEGQADESASGEGYTAGLQVMPSVIYKQSQVAAKYLRGLFGEKVFDNPKDHEVLARLIGYCTEPDNGDIVVDFFAGSGSVGDAVIRLNRADGGDRRFILVQLPEPTGRSDYPTISSLLLERLRRACAAMDHEEQATVFDNSDVGVRTLKLGSSNFRLWNPERASTSEGELAEQLSVFAESVLDGATDEDLLFEILLKSGVELSTEIERVDDAAVYVADAGRFAVCLEQPITEELVDAIAARRPDRVVFLDRGFESDAAKANAAITLHKAGVEVRVV